MPRAGRLAIIRALHLGDLLCAVPALRAIRAFAPAAHVALIGLSWAREFAARFGALVDAFAELPGFPGLPEVPVAFDRWPAFLRRMRDCRFDLVLQMHGSGTVSNGLASLLGGRRVAGFYPRGDACPDPAWFVPYPERGPEIRRLLALTSFLGIPPVGEHLEFPLSAADRAARRALDPAGRLDGCACLHPGGRSAPRRWDPERFAAVGDGLARRGMTIALTGTADEAPLTARVAAAMRAPAVDLAGRTSLGTLAAVLARSRVLVSGDTGVAHLADALDVPSAVLFDPGQVERWAPLDRIRHRVVAPLDRAQPADVLQTVAALLDAPVAPARGGEAID